MLSNEDKSYIKKSFSFWKNLSSFEQNHILDNSTNVNYKYGVCIYNGFIDCVGLLLVKSGELRTYILSEDGREITLFRINKGDVCILSASCLLNNITFDVHVDAVTDCELILINSSIFSKIAENNIYVENFMNKEAVNRFSDVMWTMEQILFKKFDQRLAIFLLDESTQKKTTVISLTHEQIAKFMGSAREVVSRMLKYFAKEGFVQLSRGEVKIIDRDGLKSLI